MAAPTVTWSSVIFDSNNSPAYTQLPTENSYVKLDMGAVQAGKITEIKCVQPLFSGSSAQNLKFWLQSRTAALNGSVNTNLVKESGWYFYHMVRRSDLTVFNHSTTVTTQLQRSGGEISGINTVFSQIPETEDESSIIQSSVANGARGPYIYLTVGTPASASDGLTDGWSYRMSFLYP